MFVLLASLGAVLATTPGLEGSGPEKAVPAWIHCTPSTWEAPGGGLQDSKHPIARAIANAGPGTVIYLDPGDYPPISIGFNSNDAANALTSGGVPGNPIVVDGAPGTRIIGRSGDAIAITQDHRNGYITFRNIIIIPGQRSGIMFYRQGNGRVHRGYTFEDCNVLGKFDPLTGEGRRAKWGVWGHSLADFRFAGMREPARVERISDEHAFYIQNHQGPITIENVQCKYVGRCFVQFTARRSEGPVGTGDITIKDCTVIDPCIAAGDGYKGGSAFTFAGRLDCTIMLDHNVCRFGFRKDMQKLTLDGAPFGTGVLMAWQGGEPIPNGTLILRDNHFSLAEGCGDRPVVSIGGTRKVVVIGTNTFISGGEQPALSIDPVNEGDGSLISQPVKQIYVARETKIEGPVLIRGKKPTAQQVKAMTTRESGGF